MHGAMTPERTTLDRLFRPRSIAVVGASSTPTKIGGRPVDYLKNSGYAGRIVPINPQAPEIQGLQAYPRLTDAPGPIDLAIVAVPASLVEATLEDAIAAGIPGLVIFSSDFAETGEEGARLQTRIAERARQAGIRLLGPNCLGFINIADECYATFSPVVQLGRPKSGSVGLVSQSGAFGAYALTLARTRGIGLSHWITTGNEADIGFAECVEWLAADPDTSVIVGYMEGARDGARLRSAFEACLKAGKPLVLCKVGRSEIGAHAAASHTAALAGEDAVFDGIFRQYGVTRADSIEKCLDIAYAAAIAGLPLGKRAGLFTVSGGAGVLMADEADAQGLDVPALTEETQRKLLEIVPFAGARNPLDITGQVVNVEGALRTSMELMARDGTVDFIVSFLAVAGLHPTLGLQFAADVVAASRATPEIAQFAVTIAKPEFREMLEAAKIAVFDDANRAVQAAAALSRFADALARAGTGEVEAEERVTVPASATEPEALALLAGAGLPAVPFKLAATPEEAGQAAAEFDVPVAVKIVSRDILHKTEADGIRLNRSGAAEVSAAAGEVLAAAQKHVPDARIDGVMVAPMVRGVAECVVGVQRDPTFGPVVMFGMGGVHVEALRDVVFRAAPFDEVEARRMIGEIRAIRLLTHPRGSGPADIDAVAKLVSKVSAFAAANADAIESLDLNPVFVGEEGEGCVIADALLIG